MKPANTMGEPSKELYLNLHAEFEPLDAMVFDLFFIQGHTLSTVANTTGLDSERLRQRYRRICQKVAELKREQPSSSGTSAGRS